MLIIFIIGISSNHILFINFPFLSQVSSMTRSPSQFNYHMVSYIYVLSDFWKYCSSHLWSHLHRLYLCTLWCFHSENLRSFEKVQGTLSTKDCNVELTFVLTFCNLRPNFYQFVGIITWHTIIFSPYIPKGKVRSFAFRPSISPIEFCRYSLLILLFHDKKVHHSPFSFY